MKKLSRTKLALATETVRALSTADLQLVQGGLSLAKTILSCGASDYTCKSGDCPVY